MDENPRVDRFIQDTLFADRDKAEIAATLREMVHAMSPQIKEDIKYGGIVFIKDGKLFCGIFIRKKHVSMEFDRGIEMQDADNLLEGNGVRRHLKIFRKEDIVNKKAGYYIKQSFALHE